MDPNKFYGRKTTRVSTLAEAREVIEQSSNPAAIFVLPPIAGDAADQESDIKEIPEDPEVEYEPAGEIEIEENTESESDHEILLLQKKKETE